MKEMHVSILEKLRYVKTLPATAPIKDAVDGRIFGEFADHGTIKPYITYDHVSTISERVGFDTANLMMHRAQFIIRVYGDIEQGAEAVCAIGDDIQEAFNFYVDENALTFDKIYYTISSGTTIERVDDTVVAAVGLSAQGIQNSGV